MATVGFREIYRYGGRFLGYLLVVGGLAGAFLAGGAYLSSQAMSLTDPTVSALSQTRAFVGVVVMAFGVVLGTIGFFGLAHKLLAESMKRALGAHEAELAVSSESTGEAGEDDGAPSEGEPDVDERDASDREPTTPGSSEPGRGTEPPSDHTQPAPVIGNPAGQRTGDEPSPEDEPVGSEPASVGGGSPTEGDNTAGAATGEDTWAGPGELADDDQSPTEEPDDSPPEWTPPDPSEFESPPDSEPAPDADEPVEESVDDEPEGETSDEEPIDPEELPDDETLADQGVESFRTGGEDDPLADRLPGDEE